MQDLRKFVSQSYFEEPVNNELDMFFFNWKKNESLKSFFTSLENLYNQFIFFTSKYKKIQAGALPFRKLNFFDDPLDFNILERGETCLGLNLLETKFKRSLHDKHLFSRAVELFDNGSKLLNKLKENYVIFDKNTKINSFPLNVKETMQISKIHNFYFRDLNQSWDLLKNKKTPCLNIDIDSERFLNDLSILKQRYQKIAKLFWKFLNKIFGPKRTKISKSLFDADLWPRITPLVLLQYLNENNSVFLNDEFRCVIGAVFVIGVNIRQIERMEFFLSKKDKHNLLKECLNIPHSNWSPSKFPGWLIFEIESNLTIREVQVKVAEQLMNHDKQKNKVLQLNMGEGKSSVIVPMLSIALADGKKLIRLIVLNSLFKINYGTLVQKLGGALNKRIYTFKFTRDMEVSQQMILDYKQILHECKENKGLFITIPEDFLSFKLKCVEMSKIENATQLLEIQNWKNRNVMDILDESDEILNVMYQCKFNLRIKSQNWKS